MFSSVLRGAALVELEERARRENATVAASLLADLIQVLPGTLGPNEVVQIEVPRVTRLAEASGDAPLIVSATGGTTRDEALRAAGECLHGFGSSPAGLVGRANPGRDHAVHLRPRVCNPGRHSVASRDS